MNDDTATERDPYVREYNTIGAREESEQLRERRELLLETLIRDNRVQC